MLFFFVSIAIWNVGIQAPDCGCLGGIKLEPEVLLAIDVSMLYLLLRWPASGSSMKNLLPSVCAAIAVISSVMIIVFTLSPLKLDDYASIVGVERRILIRPREWVGKQFPLRHFLSSTPAMNEGRWRVVFVNSHCQKCEVLASELRREETENLIFVATRESMMELDFGCHVWLDDRYVWIFDSPQILLLVDGIVVSCVST